MSIVKKLMNALRRRGFAVIQEENLDFLGTILWPLHQVVVQNKEDSLSIAHELGHVLDGTPTQMTWEECLEGELAAEIFAEIICRHKSFKTALAEVWPWWQEQGPEYAKELGIDFSTVNLSSVERRVRKNLQKLSS